MNGRLDVARGIVMANPSRQKWTLWNIKRRAKNETIGSELVFYSLHAF